MSSFIQDKQRAAYDELITTGLADTIKNCSVDFKNGYRLDFEMFPIMPSAVVEQEGTEYLVVRAMCKLTNKNTMEEAEFTANLLDLPRYGELGFMIKGSNKQRLDLYLRATGWSFTTKKSVNDPDYENHADVFGTNKRKISFVYKAGGAPYVDFKVTGSDKGKVSLSVFLRALTGMSNDELLDMFGCDNPYVLLVFGENEKAANIGSDKKYASIPGRETKAACIRELATAMVGANRVNELNNLTELEREVHNRIFNKNYLNLGPGNYKRFLHTQSFMYRALGKMLAEDLVVADKTIPYGTVLDAETLTLIDHAPIFELKVLFNGKAHHLHKFSRLTFNALGYYLAEDLPELQLSKGTQLGVQELEMLNSSKLLKIKVKERKENKAAITIERRTYAESLMLDDLLTAMSIWLNNLNGYDTYDETFELTNRIVQPVDVSAKEYVVSHLDAIIAKVREKTEVLQEGTSLINAIPAFDNTFSTQDLIQAIQNMDNTESQMSDITNIMSFVSKDYKVTSDIGSRNGTAAMLEVQDLQNGRLDPFDVPESAQIGRVHHRTMYAKEDVDGYLTAPYLRVKDGEVVSTEPEYLTANEESGKYIAEWNETFLDENGNKKERVLARINGNVVSIATHNVTYKEYSPMQNMSPTHGAIPFAGHSNGKRITMSCNQQNQALITMRNERPLVGTGVESMLDIGNYTAESLLKEFFANITALHPKMNQYRDQIMNSELILVSIKERKNERTFVFKVTEMDEINGTRAAQGLAPLEAETSLTVPFHIKTFESSSFSFKLNAKTGGRYRGSDVIAYNAGYSLHNPGVVKCVDFGGETVSDEVFERGTAIGQNLLVAYKTWEGSTIDDALVINKRLVMDDTLTHIALISVRHTLKSRPGVKERFSAGLDATKSYIQSTGLPRIGAWIGQGDTVFSVTATRTDATGAVQTKNYFHKARRNETGYVISAVTREVNGEVEGEVILAHFASTEIGDKYSGRYGNKGVVAAIVPEDEMPYDPVTGEIVDVILNPLGIPSRQNISQILEAALAYAMRRQGKLAVVSQYNKKDLDFVKEQANGCGVQPRTLIDGRTGYPFERPVNVGVLYLMKLHHTVETKMHSIGMDAEYDPVFLQPKRGAKRNGGQSFGEMESWCLESVGAFKVLQFLHSAQSDDHATIEENMAAYASDPFAEPSSGVNFNDKPFQAFYRTLGMEIESDADAQEFVFRPLTDKDIRALAPKEIVDKRALHSEEIFGDSKGTVTEQMQNRDKWGYIELNVKIVHPTFLVKGSIHKLIICDDGQKVRTVSSKHWEQMLHGTLGVIADEPGKVIRLVAMENGASSAFQPSCTRLLSMLPEAQKSSVLTGMEAIVWMLENYDVGNALEKHKEALSAYEAKHPESTGSSITSTHDKLLKQYNLAAEFVKSGRKLSDYVISKFPVMPQSYRPLLDSVRSNEMPDFDIYYGNIIDAATKARQNRNIDHGTDAINVYNQISLFIGYDTKSGSTKKYQNVLNWFAGKNVDASHGKIRTALQSKRLLCSGRTVIIPTANSKMPPTSLGVPAQMLVNMYRTQLISYMRYQLSKVFGTDAKSPNAAGDSKWVKLLSALAQRNFANFSNLYHDRDRFTSLFKDVSADEAYKLMTTWFVDYIQGNEHQPGQMVLHGRQPSLHKYSIRAFNIEVVYTKAIQIHPLVCKGYNADFDGDQTWVTALLGSEVQEEARRLLSPAVDFLNPKNNEIILEHSQDIVLGVYCATMLKDNACKIHTQELQYYSDCDAIVQDLKDRLLHTFDPVCFSYNGKKYLSTAGRILFNSLIPGGFTDEPFKDTIGFEVVKPERFFALKYDGIIKSGKGNSHGMQYYNLKDICKALYQDLDAAAIDVYQKITEFGFQFSDTHSVTLCIGDLEIPYDKEAVLQEAANLRTRIEQDFQDGLISSADKTKAVMNLYGDKKNGANPKILKGLQQTLDRNNNLFIMMDSGARGNATQMMHMCGAVGILQKTKTEDLETSVTSNYFEGLGSFDVHLASYSARTGVSSTQNETSKAGYSTRKAVYLAGGIEIVEQDCGKQNWWYDIKWGDRIANLDRFMPNKQWIHSKVVGNKIVQLEPSLPNFADKDAIFTEEMVEDFCTAVEEIGGFHFIAIDNGKEVTPVVVSASQLLNEALVFTDANYAKLYRLLDKNDTITSKCLKVIEKRGIKKVDTTSGTYSFRYKMDGVSRDLLMHRVARGLKYTNLVKDSEGTPQEVITAKTLDYIEKEGIERVEARVILDCHSNHGVCAHCYGLKYSSLKFPKLHEFVGIESAQSIGEPAAQLTISLVNKGGVAGESVANGVDLFTAALDGSVPHASKSPTATVAWDSGYVEIIPHGDSAALAISPIDKTCATCTACQAKRASCPRSLGKSLRTDLPCVSSKNVKRSTIIVYDGECVEAGDPLTSEQVLPTSIQKADVSTAPADVLRKRQVSWLENYHNIFTSNSIFINVRHFENLVRVQTGYALVSASEDPNFQVGSVYEIAELLKATAPVDYCMQMSKLEDVVLRNSGALTALTFANMPQIAANLVDGCHRSSMKHNAAPIGMLSVGANLATGEIKKLSVPAFKSHTSDHTVKSGIFQGAAVTFVPKATSDELTSLKAFDLFTEGDGSLDIFGDQLADFALDLDATVTPISAFDSVNLDDEELEEDTYFGSEPIEAEPTDYAGMHTGELQTIDGFSSVSTPAVDNAFAAETTLLDPLDDDFLDTDSDDSDDDEDSSWSYATDDSESSDFTPSGVTEITGF